MPLTSNPDLQSLIPPLSHEGTLPLAEICLSDQVQQRVALDPAKVAEYADLYREGRDLGRLVVFEMEATYLLADGFHRLQAATEAGLTAVPVEVHAGSLRAAILYATSCNLHGQPLTNADKRKRVQTLLADPEWAQWSDNSMAKHCGVAQSFVSRLRHQHSLISELSEDETAPPTRTYRDRYGQVRTMDTRAIGQQPASDHQANATGVLLEPEAPAPAPPAILTEVLDPEPPAPAPASPHTVSSGDPEWYTPLEVLPLIRAVLGAIDVDPASCAEAQARVQARTYYTLAEDGLRQRWPGTVFCNPPFHMPDIARFCGKLLEELDAGQTTAAILLTNSVTDTGWFHLVAPRADAICFTDGRMQFTHATRNGDHPRQGQAVFYFGPQAARFREVFAAIGLLMQVVGAKAAGPQLALAAAPPAPADPAPPPDLTPRRAVVGRPAAVLRMVWQLQPCTNAQVAKAMGAPRNATHQVLQSLVKQGTVRREGQTYTVVDASTGTAGAGAAPGVSAAPVWSTASPAMNPEEGGAQ